MDIYQKCRNCGMNLFRCDCKTEDVFSPAPRASRMPEHLPSVDPTFLDGVREYAPDEKAIGEGMMNAAKVPWTVEKWSDGQGSKGISIKSADGLHIANMVMSLRDDELATARFLCRAANCHTVLLDALRGLVEERQPLGIDRPAYKAALSTIAKAERA